MVIAVYGTKGGVGVSTFATMLAAALAGPAHNSVLVDLRGDLPDLCGVEPTYAQGATEWAEALAAAPSDAVDRLSVRVTSELKLLPRGDLDPNPETSTRFVETLDDRLENVIIDCGPFVGAHHRSADHPFRHNVAAACDHRILVTRACYLGLRAATEVTPRATGVALLVEPGRALHRSDVEAVVGSSVAIEVAIDPLIARLVDAGLLATKLPRRLRRCLDRALDPSIVGDRAHHD